MHVVDCINSQCGAFAGDCGCAARVREAAAFLDGLADHMDYRGGWTATTAAECRTMAKKLRGET
jgi:hypothetical protein